MKEKVVWTTGNDGKSNYCVGFFNEDVDRPFIIKEANSAPIDFETLKSRVSLNKQRKELVTDPTNPGYNEQFVLLVTSKDLDEEDIKEIKLPYVGNEVDKASINISINGGNNLILSNNTKYKTYKFYTSNNEDSMKNE